VLDFQRKKKNACFAFLLGAFVLVVEGGWLASVSLVTDQSNVQRTRKLE
jgi:hypothetical protein